MAPNDFCAFILTHGRPDHVYTYNTLKKHGYTGPVYLIIDNEDQTSERYYQKFGKQVIMFDKLAVSKTFDTGDNFEDRRTIVYARNACFQIARDLGFTYFIELDDDYTGFTYRFVDQEESWNKPIKNVDTLFNSILEYYKHIPAKSVALSQGGDFLGGVHGIAAHRPRFRKCMNSFFCSIDRPFQFFGRINEDVNTYAELGRRGMLFLTISTACLEQKTTQTTSGGMTDIYHNLGTYVKSFYTVLYAPSCTQITMMHSRHPRLHHLISWRNAVPVILRERHKKWRQSHKKLEPNDDPTCVYSAAWYLAQGLSAASMRRRKEPDQMTLYLCPECRCLQPPPHKRCRDCGALKGEQYYGNRSKSTEKTLV